MPLYRVSVRETIGVVMEIRADDEEQAEERAKERYNSQPSDTERYELEAEVLETTHAKCEACDQRMAVNNGCTATKLIIKKGSSSYGALRVPYDQLVPCHDCNVGFDQLHHPGCDMERCPSCGGQAISCGHVTDWAA
jgi:hypothetical protein